MLLLAFACNGDSRTEGENTAFGLEGAYTAAAFADGLYAAAAVAVSLPRAEGQTVFHNYLAGVRIFDLDKELSVAFLAVKVHLS